MAQEKQQEMQRNSENITRFTTAQDAWFWFIDAQTAKEAGVYMKSASGFYNRPCEPVDILVILDRLYRKRQLLRDHVLVLRHYGKRKMPPDSRRIKEQRAAMLWDEAMDILEEALIAKAIVEPPCLNAWHTDADTLSGIVPSDSDVISMYVDQREIAGGLV